MLVPNRRHLYPLLQKAFIAHPRLFLCPSNGGAPMPVDQVQRCNDFLDDANLSYTYFNMAGQRPSSEDNPDLPLMSDQNPVFGESTSFLGKFAFRDRAHRIRLARRGRTEHPGAWWIREVGEDARRGGGRR